MPPVYTTGRPRTMIESQSTTTWWKLDKPLRLDRQAAIPHRSVSLPLQRDPARRAMTMAKAGMDLSAFVGEAADRDLAFSVPNHRDQLVAGYAKFKQNGGLVMHVPDYKAPSVMAAPHRP